MKDRDLSLDIIRIVACCLAVFMHSPIPSANANGPFLSALSYLTSPCIGLFFMVSGALLCPVKLDYFTFIKKRLAKIVIPTLLWTGIYLSINLNFSEPKADILRTIASIPFSAQGHGVLWFMYTLIGLYLLAPILSSWATSATNSELQFVLLLWAVSLCYPLLSYVVDINASSTGVLYYFTGYAGYFILGYALKHGRLHIPLAISAATSIIGVIVLVTFKKFDIQYDFYSLFWYESIFIVALCCVYWMGLSKYTKTLLKFETRGRLTEYLRVLSNASFGIYLMHILIMRNWLWNTAWIQGIHNYVLQTISIAGLTLIISSILSVIMCRLPILHYLVGYRRK